MEDNSSSNHDTMHKLFVYGTLKKGQPNEYKMKTLPSARFLADAVTVKTFPLVVGTPWSLPILIELPQGKNVRGELHEVDDETLQILDDFEEHPDVYRRKYIDVRITKSASDEIKGASTVRCWAYFYVQYTDEDIHSEHLESYDYLTADRKYDIRENPDHPDNKADG